MLTEDRIKTTFVDVAGCDEAKEEVAELVEYLREPEITFPNWAVKFRRASDGRPPGTGKPCWQTLRVKRRCHSLRFGSDFVEMFVGVGASQCA